MVLQRILILLFHLLHHNLFLLFIIAALPGRFRPNTAAISQAQADQEKIKVSNEFHVVLILTNSQSFLWLRIIKISEYNNIFVPAFA
jgi:hypothetical protein